MPLYRFRLEAQDGSGHIRQGTTEADSDVAARNWLELRELQFATFTLDDGRIAELCADHDVETLDDLPAAAPVAASEEEKAAFRALPVRDRSHLNLHRQEQPYKLVELEEVS
jgi:hypothetical protein